MTKPKTKPLIVQAAKAQTGHPLKNLLLIYLADFWSADKGAYPSQTTLAKRCSVSRKDINEKLGELESDGWIKSKQLYAESGAKKSKEYHLIPAMLHVTTGDIPCNEGLHTMSPQVTTHVTTGDTISLVKSLDKSLMKITPTSPSDFDIFYDSYPRKVKRQAAEKAWKKLAPQPSLVNRILIDVARRVEQGHWLPDQKKQYIPHPTTYLNGAGWTDEILPDSDFKPSPEQQAMKTRALLDEMDKENSWIQ